MTTNGRSFHIVNAEIWTADPAHPRARALSVQDGVIAALDVPASGEIPTIDLGGRWVGPSFIDAHLHITLGAATLAQCNLAGCRTRAEFESRVRDHRATLDAAGERDAWLVAFGWNEADWKGDAPTREWLAATDRPAVAWRMDQHSCVVNSAALALLDTTPIDGGEIEP